MSPRIRVLAVMTAGLLAVSGCTFKGADSLPLPGGAAHGKTYHVTAIFPDVQDLTVQAAVRVNDVAVGDVTSITLGRQDLQAHVGMAINDSVHLPANAVATLEQTTLLGEKFVALAAPTKVAPQGTLTDGAVISSGSSSELPSVEEVFGLLSQVLNGGDLADLQTINVEVSKALAGRETAVRGALTQLDRFVTGLASQKHEIVRALNSLDRFSSALASQDSTIATALDEIGPGLKVLADEREQFTSLLTDLSTFGQVATHVINASRADTETGLRDLEPILHHLAAAGADLPQSLEILLTFPFPQNASQASPGDYTNFSAATSLAPVVCAALEETDPAQYAAIFAISGPLLHGLLNGNPCPKAGKHAPPAAATPATPSPGTGSPGSGSPGTGSGGGGSSGGGSSGGTPGAGTTSSPTPAPSPTTSGLADLLQGLSGGMR